MIHGSSNNRSFLRLHLRTLSIAFSNKNSHLRSLLPLANLVKLFLQLQRWNSQSVAVAEEQDTLTLTSGIGTGLNPLAPACAGPHRLDEAEGAILDIRTVVLAHDRLNGLSCLVSVVKGDGADVVVEDVGLDNSMEELSSDKAEFTVDGCSSATSKVPAVRFIMGEGWVGVLEESDGD